MSYSPDSATLAVLSHFQELLHDPQVAQWIVKPFINAGSAEGERLNEILGTISHVSRISSLQ